MVLENGSCFMIDVMGVFSIVFSMENRLIRKSLVGFIFLLWVCLSSLYNLVWIILVWINLLGLLLVSFVVVISMINWWILFLFSRIKVWWIEVIFWICLKKVELIYCSNLYDIEILMLIIFFSFFMLYVLWFNLVMSCSRLICEGVILVDFKILGLLKKYFWKYLKFIFCESWYFL